MGNQDGQHFVLCADPAGDAKVRVHRQKPVPPLRPCGKRSSSSHGKRPVMAVDSVAARPSIKLFRGSAAISLNIGKGDSILHGEIHPGAPSSGILRLSPSLKPSGKQADIRIAFALQFFSGNGTIQRASCSIHQERRGFHISTLRARIFSQKAVSKTQTPDEPGICCWAWNSGQHIDEETSPDGFEGKRLHLAYGNGTYLSHEILFFLQNTARPFPPQ